MFAERIVNNASGAVALMFRKIIEDNKMTNTFRNLIDVYASDNSTNSSDKSRIKTNYTTHTDNGEMTIKIFNMLFRNILKVKEIHFTVDIKYGDEILTVRHLVKEVDEKNDDATVYEIYRAFLKLGLSKDLDNKLDGYVKTITKTNVEETKKKYELMKKNNSKKMSFKTLILFLNNIFGCEYLILSVNILHGKHTMSSTVKINF